MILYIWKIQYILVEEESDVPEHSGRRSFGIMAVRRSFRGQEELAYVGDISPDRAFVVSLVKRCNRRGLSPVHLQDFILDVLGS